MIARHGKYNLDTGHLTEWGKLEAGYLALGIQGFLYEAENPLRAAVFTSPETRARESAEIIKDTLGLGALGLVETEVLGLDDRNQLAERHRAAEELMRLFSVREPTSAILVTHAEVAMTLAFNRALIGGFPALGSEVPLLDNGQALGIDAAQARATGEYTPVLLPKSRGL